MKHLFAALLCLVVAAASAQAPGAAESRRSGFEFMGASTQAMQKDDALNPAMLGVSEGEALWNRVAGASGKACVSCHATAQSSMRGVSARYPAFDDKLGRPITLSQRINQCRQQHQQAAPLRSESQELLSLESYVALQSRGLPLAPPVDERLRPYRQRGEVLFMQRIGQLNLSCAQCHDSLAGQRLAGSVIPQAHPTAYPLYRLEWQAIGSLQRRIRGCMSGVRAEPFAYGAQELVELELYLNQRATGMKVESPGVRP
ncbi:sulfur oxidation c-type cytochrome SoxA [Polaromonas sp.]|uniref:sulfur oxidation c-type cytochrome SoxA n=1 Tax=Polaromonas sp. TaxID=1869339 RepID=UPI0032642A44